MLKLLGPFCLMTALLGVFLVKRAEASSLPCAGLQLREVPVGTVCKTSKEFEFELISRGTENREEVWKDKSSGLTWYDTWPVGNQYYAFTICTLVQKLDLPTKNEFEVAESHAFREVLPNIKGKWFWSSSVSHSHSSDAWVFSGSFGYLYVDDYRDSYDYSVRCVAR